MPFGGNSDLLTGEKHPPHGEIVGEKWKYVGTTKSADVTTLTMSIETRVRRGEVTKGTLKAVAYLFHGIHHPLKSVFTGIQRGCRVGQRSGIACVHGDGLRRVVLRDCATISFRVQQKLAKRYPRVLGGTSHE